MPPHSQGSRKPYRAPSLRKLTLEQARLICIPYAWIGEEDAKELLEWLFPENLATQSQDSKFSANIQRSGSR